VVGSHDCLRAGRRQDGMRISCWTVRRGVMSMSSMAWWQCVNCQTDEASRNATTTYRRRRWLEYVIPYWRLRPACDVMAEFIRVMGLTVTQMRHSSAELSTLSHNRLTQSRYAPGPPTSRRPSAVW